MTHLNIQQGSNVEIVTAQIIKKLYDAALSVPEPQSGEEDAAYMSGNLQVNKAYRSQVEYLTNRFDDLSINVTVAYYIDFEDSNILNILLANNISSDGVGVTETDAATATLTASMFMNDISITSFNTFNYFTKANNNPAESLFRNCTNLASINLSNVTKLSNHEFRGSGLTSVVIPEGIEYIPESCFYRCSQLSSVVLPQSCVELRSTCFQNCTTLKSINLSNVQIIRESAFVGSDLSETIINMPSLTGDIPNSCFKNTKITSITNLGNITSLSKDARNASYNEGCFQGCTSLTTVTLPSTITEMSCAFSGCTNLTTINGALENLVKIGYDSFSNTKISYIPNMSGVQTLEYCCFYNANITAGVINLQSLTNIGNKIFANQQMDQLYIPLLSNTNSSGSFRNYATCTPAFGGDNNRRFKCDLMYFKDLQKIYSGAFCLISSYALIINNNTPPIWANNQDKTDQASNGTEGDKKRMFKLSNFDTKLTTNVPSDPDPSTIKVYVPNSAVATYQNDSLWGTYCTILPISDLNSGVIYATEADWTTAGKPVGLIAEYLGLSTADLATFVSANNLTYYVAPSS